MTNLALADPSPATPEALLTLPPSTEPAPSASSAVAPSSPSPASLPAPLPAPAPATPEGDAALLSLPPSSESDATTSPTAAPLPAPATTAPTEPLAKTETEKGATPQTAASPKATDAAASSPLETEEAFEIPPPPEDDSGFVPSYGTWPKSIMYPSTEITNVKNILALYERKGFLAKKAVASPEGTKEGGTQAEAQTLEQQLKEKPLPSDLVFPSFKLRSLVYHGKNQWAVWLNNRRITNANNKQDNEFVVLSINKESVEFAWIPTNAELLSAILQRQLLGESAFSTEGEDAAKRPKSPEYRKAFGKEGRGGRLDRNTSVIHFVLRPNQVFYAETFEVFEGLPNSLAPSIQRAIQLEKHPDDSETPAKQDPTDIINKLKEQLGDEVPESVPEKKEGSADAEVRAEAGQQQSPKAKMMRTLGLAP